MSRAGHTWLPSVRVFVAISLAVGYLALTGEAIHCQFVPTGHHEHQGRTSQPISHAAHCLLANHSTVAVATVVVMAGPVLYPIRLPGERRHHRDVAPHFSLLPARAPPTI